MRFLLLCASATAAAAVYVPGKAFDRFITIWLENQDFSAVSQDPDAIDLTQEGILLTSYYGVTHPSQPNYIASVGGDYFGLDHGTFVRIPQNVSTLVDLLDTKGISWKGYFEGLPGPGFMGEGSSKTDGSPWNYVRKHNPFVSYDSINMNGTRLAQLQSFIEFENDVSTNNLPQYAHMSPDMLNDGHDTSLAYATNWTLSFLTPLLLNPKFMERTLILLTYDESATYAKPNKIVSLLLGGAVPENLKGTTDDTVYSHYSILSTLESNWGLPNLGRYDVGANVFSLVAGQTGYVNHAPPNIASINNSLSYPGFLNSHPNLYKDLPPPNILLVGAGGQGVDATVFNDWEVSKYDQTPYDGSGAFFDGGDGQSSANFPAYKTQSRVAVFTSTTSAAKATGTRKSTTSTGKTTAASPGETKESSGTRIPLNIVETGLGLGVLSLVLLYGCI